MAADYTKSPVHYVEGALGEALFTTPPPVTLGGTAVADVITALKALGLVNGP